MSLLAGAPTNGFKQRVNLFFNPIDNGDPIANSFKGQSFREAVQKDVMKDAFNVFYFGNDELKKYCGKYLISLGLPKFVDLIKRARDNVKEWLLEILLVHADQLFVNEVLTELKPSNGLLRGVAYSADLACVPRRFTYLLGRINSKEYQERAVEYGVRALINENKTKCFDPLLNALNEGSFLNTDLENIAIHEAFEISSGYKDDRALLAKRFFDHPTISAKDYSDALFKFLPHWRPR